MSSGEDSEAQSAGASGSDRGRAVDSRPGAAGSLPAEAPSASPPREPGDVSPGETVAGYEILDEIGKGGMGRVYRARQVALDRIVALKILPERLSANAEFIDRFAREAKAAAKLDHPNIVRAIDAGKAGHRFYLAMEFVEGSSLEDVLRTRGSLPEEEALGIVIQIARGIECIWRGGLIHGDIKPGNVLLTREGAARIADLGLARATRPADETHDARDWAGMGTPHYMSPEQVHGEDLDIRTDIYSLGITFYRAVTGELPFTGKDAVSIVMARFEESAKPANEVNPAVSDETAQVIATMMSLDRDLRHPDPAVLLHDLELLARGRGPEFAGRSDTERQRAVGAAKLKRALKTVPETVVVRRRLMRELTALIVGVVAALALVVTFMLLRGGRAESPPNPGAGEALAADAERLLEEVGADFEAGRYADAMGKVETAGERYLGTPCAPRLEAIRRRAASAMAEESASTLYSSVLQDFEAEGYARVVERVDEGGGRHAGTSYGPKLHALRSRAAARLEEAERRAAAEGERERRLQELVRLAREELGLGNHKRATDLLIQAKAIRETPEIVRLAEDAQRAQRLAGAKEAEIAGKLAEAVRLYELALQAKEDDELGVHVSELRRRLALEHRLGEAGGLAGKGSWRDARAAYLGALDLARGPEADAIGTRLETVDRKIRYLDLLEKARALARAQRWEEVLDASREAGSLEPEADEPRVLMLQARQALGPEKEITDSVGMAFVLVPAGAFTMGSDEGGEDERPAHEVSLDGYYVGKYEVTNRQFELFSPAHRHERKRHSSGDDMPVVAVTWEEAMAFCRWLGQKGGIEYRLPTEAEWERAARGTDARAFPWGNDPPENGAVYRCNFAPGGDAMQWKRDGFGYAAPVGSFPAGVSAHGCHDMAGNVWEWCLDWYAADSYRAVRTANPRGPAQGDRRVVRGGSFGNGARTLRCSNRRDVAVGFFDANVGFRCVRAVEAAE